MNVAIAISSADNVATALDTLEAGRLVPVGGSSITLTDTIPRGHKFAIAPIQAGAQVMKYGSAIGSATADIAPGMHVHTHNVASTRGRGDLSRVVAVSREE